MSSYWELGQGHFLDHQHTELILLNGKIFISLFIQWPVVTAFRIDNKPEIADTLSPTVWFGR